MQTHRSFAGLMAGIALSLTGCMIGQSAEKYPVALRPQGTQVSALVGKQDIRGELLEVRDSSIVVLTPKEVVLLPFPVIKRLTLLQERQAYYNYRLNHYREHFRLRSRFPNGLGAEPLAQLLQARGQQTLRTYEK